MRTLSSCSLLSLTCVEFENDLIFLSIERSVEGDGDIERLTTSQNQTLHLVLIGAMGFPVLFEVKFDVRRLQQVFCNEISRMQLCNNLISQRPCL